MQRFHIVPLIGISLMTNEIEHSVMVYWPFVCMRFSFMEMSIVLTFILFLIFLPQHSAFELCPWGGVGSSFFASDSCRVYAPTEVYPFPYMDGR